jgi:iron(III) transport system ATP-binding protein
MGDRIVLMKEGRIEQIGPPAEVYARPVSPYAANFLGVRNKLVANNAQGLLWYGANAISGSESLAKATTGDGKLQLFVRARDTHVYRDTSSTPALRPDEIEIEGTIAQIVLGDGGRLQYVVDVEDNLWYAQHAEDPDLAPGDKVRVRTRAALSLLYQDEKLVSQ